MSKTESRMDARVFNMASHLFGVPQDTKRSKAAAKEIVGSSNPNRIIAVFPSITNDAFAQTLDNYRKFVATYNFRTAEENGLIEKHNKAVHATLAKGLTLVQQQFKPLFERNHAGLKNRAYNEKVDEFCREYGPIVKKRKIQTVKPSSELIFQNIIHVYNTQLIKRNDQYMRLRVFTPRPIQECKVNAYLITKLKRNEVISLNLCKKTIRNHRERLEECGVFTEYHFAGAQRPVELHINPEILVVQDIIDGKFVMAQNQHFSPDNGKVLPDTDESTRAIINEYEMRENVENNSPDDKVFAPLTPKPFVFYGNTVSSLRNSEIRPAPGDVKFSPPPEENTQEASPPTLSDRLTSLIIHPQRLAEQLANQMHCNYSPIDIRWLEKEAYRGTMTNEEFRELVLQDFFKCAAKLWRDSSPYVGSWKKAINLYYENKFKFTNGVIWNKHNIASDIAQLRWRLERARKYCLNNPNFRLLFPRDYFDMTRTSAKEGGFEYTKNAWLKHLKYLEQTEARKRLAEAKAARRKKANNYANKCRTRIRNFYRNKITMPEVFDYVERNLPAEYMAKLPKMIEKIGHEFKP